MAPDRASKRRRLSPPEEGRAVPGFAQWNLEQAYEQRPRKNKKKDESNRLPIKRGGRIEQNTAAEMPAEATADEPDSSDGEAEDAAAGVAAAAQQPTPAAKPAVPPKEQVRLAKEDLARIAGAISESPDENVGQLKALAGLAASENVTVQRLALGTQLAVFKDIIPGYRIRALAKDDARLKVSKDVRRLRDFEQGLLSAYREFVEHLAALARGREEGLAGVAVFCTCALLESVPHFNFRNDLIAILVRKLAGRTVNSDLIKAREALERLFREDEEGHASLEAVTQLTKLMKARDYHVHESVLNTFLHLRLLSEFVHKASTTSVDRDDAKEEQGGKKAKQKKEFRTKRERKVLRERKEVEKEMKEADAVVSYEDRDKNQAEMLKLVFVAYFRILKARTQHLMGAVLEGLAKYAHLINQDFFGDVLEALKDLINDAQASLNKDGDDSSEDEEEEDPDLDHEIQRDVTRESLLCIITAFALLQGQSDVAKSASSLHLDLNFFITHLYRTLLPLSLEPDVELGARGGGAAQQHLADPNGLAVPSAPDARVNVATTTVLLLRSLHAVLLPAQQTKMVPPVRLAAFTKQLLAAALQLPPKSAQALVALLQQVSRVHGRRIAALWSSEERRGDGVFDALAAEVESSNPFASTVWEGELLRLHFDPKVREGIRAVEKNVAEGR